MTELTHPLLQKAMCFRGLFFLIVFWTGSLPARCQTYNPNVLPLGDKEALMGNTGTGGIASVGAVYYNPGCLPMVKGNSFSLSGSAYMKYRFSAEPLVNFGNTPVNFSGTGYQSIPTSLIMVRGWKKWYLGFSVLIPMQFAYEGQETWLIPASGQNLKLKLLANYSEQSTLAGLTFARRFENGWSAGLSIFGRAYRYLSTNEARGTLENDPAYVVQVDNRTQGMPIDLLLVGGVQKMWDHWNLGLCITSQGIPLFGTGSYYDFYYSNFDGQGNEERTEVDIIDSRVVYKTPLDIRAGVVFHPGDHVLFALDGAYRMGLQYNTFVNQPSFDSRESLKGNYRVNAGTELRASDKLAFYLGGSYTPTTLKATEGDIGQDFWAGFLGWKLSSEHVDSSVGFFYSYGKGTGTLTSDEGGGKSTQLYEFMGITLGTNYKF